MSALPLPAGAMAATDPVIDALLGRKAPEPFVWGKGGAKMSPEQVAMMRERGQAIGRADFSPVGHWLQGLGRVAEGIQGGLMTKRAGRMAEENAARDAELAEAMTAGAVDDATIARVLMDPSAGEGVKRYAAMEWERRQPGKPPAPTNIEKLMLARGIQPGTPEWNAGLDSAILNETDPFVTFQGPTYGYTGRQSGLAAAMQGGGGQTSGAPQTTAPPAEAVAALKRGEGTAEQFDEMFGAGAAARVLGGQASAPDPFP